MSVPPMIHDPANPARPAKPLKHRFFQAFPHEVLSFPCPTVLTDPVALHHLRNVLRLGPGMPLMIVDGERQKGYAAEIVAVERDRVEVMLLSLEVQGGSRNGRDPMPHVTLGASLIKGQRWDWLLQKVTELGVRTVVPLESERAVVHIGSPKRKQERWQAVTRSAAEQSEGLFYPGVDLPMGLTAFCDRVRSCPVKVVLLVPLDREWRERCGHQEHPEQQKQRQQLQPPKRHERREPLRKILREHATAKPMAFAVGPEGGWTEGETEYLLSQGFRPAELGKRVLRSETAAVALLSAMAYEYDTYDTYDMMGS